MSDTELKLTLSGDMAEQVRNRAREALSARKSRFRGWDVTGQTEEIEELEENLDTRRAVMVLLQKELED
jgi:hypothetical protein